MATKKRTNSTSQVGCPETLDDCPFYGMKLDREQLEFANAIWSDQYDIIFCNARAGTGKTTIATGVADMLVQYGKFDGIIYIMSPYGERKQGYIPGSITEKSSVYFEGFYQAMTRCNVNINSAVSTDSIVNQKNGSGYVECITDTFLRGSTLDNAVIIIDEAQNYTVAQLKKVLTRVGDHSKVVVIGHDEQCDLEKPCASGFTRYLEHFKGMPRALICMLATNYRSWISRHADEFSDCTGGMQ